MIHSFLSGKPHSERRKMLIGKRIKELRKSKKMSLTALSKHSGVQLATLSRMENLKMTGTLESHMSIAKALGISLTELYSDIMLGGERVGIKAPGATGEIFVHSDKSSFEILSPKILSKKMMPVLLKLGPGGKTNREQNQIGTEKFAFVLEGRVEVNFDKESYPLSQYNSLYFDASLKHCFINIGKRPAKVLCVTTPVAL